MRIASTGAAGAVLAAVVLAVGAGSIAFARSKAAAGTGAGSPRQQVNTVSSYIDAWSVYGGTAARLEWLRAGPVDGNLANNSARLLTGPDDYLPRATARGDV